MFERQFGLRENPFAAGHQSRFVYPSREHQEALAHLRYGIENREPFVLITGEVGTGKTTALYDVLSEWQSRVTVALITNSALTRDELLEEICVRFGVAVPAGVSKPQLMIQLERHLHAVRARGDRAILLLDEAQNLHRDLLEEIRLLSNLEAQGDKLMQVFLVGQPELEALLSRPELRQLRQRIAVHYRLHPLSEDDTERYIHHRITVAGGHALTIFPAEACAVVHQLTHGIPREINTVCSQAMLNAFVEDSGIVMPEHVSAVARETEFQSVVRGEASPAPRAPAAARPPAEPVPDRGAPPPPPAEAPAPTRGEAPPAVQAEPPATVRPESAEPGRVQTPGRQETPAVRPAGTREQWEGVRSMLASDRGRTPPPPMPEPPAEFPGAAAEEISHESESASAHTRAAESWHGPEAAPPPAPLHAEATPVPAGPAPSHTEAPPAPVPSAALPPSLRRKLEFIEEEEEEKVSGHALRRVTMVAVAVVAIAGAVFAARYFTRSRAAAAPPAPESTRPTAGAPADSATRPVADDAVKPAPTPPAPPASPTPAPAATAPATRKPAPAPAGQTDASQAATRPPSPARDSVATPPAAGAPATTASAPDRAARPRPEAPARTFGIAVGTFLDEARAQQERAKLAAATGLAGRVVTVDEGGDQLFRVVLGSFPDRASAERTAGRLIESGAVDEARIVDVGS